MTTNVSTKLNGEIGYLPKHFPGFMVLYYWCNLKDNDRTINNYPTSNFAFKLIKPEGKKSKGVKSDKCAAHN